MSDPIVYPHDVDYGLLGPMPPNVVSVIEWGADPFGVDDCLAAFQAAVDSLPTEGGQIIVPPGRYMLSGGVSLPSNTNVVGSGRGVTTIVAQTNFPGATPNTLPNYSFFFNANWDAANLASGDSDISVSGITFDYSWRTTSNAFASLKFRYITRLRIENCYFYYGGNAIAIRGCEQAWVVGNNAFEFRNCSWDFWEAPGTTYVMNNYAETSDTAQMMNFNPEVSPIAESPLDVAARRLIVTGNVFKATGAATEPCQIEPLADRDNSVDEVVISNNQFIRTYLVCRQQTTRVLITNNVFTDFVDTDPAVAAMVIHAMNGREPDSVIIANNIIHNPHTTSSGQGVIRCEVNKAIVTGNIITGTLYDAQPFYQGAYFPNQYGNYFEKMGITGRMRQGFVLTNPNDSTNNLRACIGWEDLDGDALRMFMSGDLHQFWSTNADGTARQVWSVQANNNSSAFTWLVENSFADKVRISPDAGLTAAGSTSANALQLTKCYNEVTTVSAGTGVRLPVAGGGSVVGLRVTVWNAGANTLNVYPMPGGQINALGADVADTIAAGASKTYVALSATLYRVES